MKLPTVKQTAPKTGSMLRGNRVLLGLENIPIRGRASSSPGLMCTTNQYQSQVFTVNMRPQPV